MMEFRGEVSNKVKCYLLKHNAIVAFFSALIPILLFGIGFIIVYLLIPAFELWMFLICEVFLLIILVLAYSSPYIYKKKTLANLLTKSIRINNDGVINAEFENSYMQKAMNDIKRILDFGDWYYIVFEFPKNANLACQKNLIIQGNIEEFEKLFNEKIIRKNAH